MLHIPNYVAPSSIHGLGVFSAEGVKKGTLIWTYESSFDRRYTEFEFNQLSPVVHEYFKVYGYQDKQDGYFYLTIDNDRFTNHSDFPNTMVDTDGNCYALRDIQAHEELTSNYREFYADWEVHFPFIVREVEHAAQTA